MSASPHIFRKPLPDQDGAANLRLRVGEHVVDFGALRVATNPGAPRLTSKAAGVLLELARHAGDTVTRDQLLDRVWKDRVTTPDVLTQAIKELRRAFSDDARPPRYIETVPKIGYRLLAAVSELDTPALRIASGRMVPGSANDDAHDDIAPAAHAAPGAPHANRVARFLLISLVALLIAAAALVVLRPAAVPATAAGQWRATDVRMLTSDPGPERRPRLSPDGTRVLYSQMDPATKFERLTIRGVNQSSAVHITERAFAHEEVGTWSPDGTRIAFERLVDKTEACTMYIVPATGGAETEVGPCGNFLVNYFDWAPDGKSFITVDQQAAASGHGLPIALLDLSTGKKTVLDYERLPSDQDLDPRYSPDGRWISFRRGMVPHSDLFVMPAGGGKVRQLTHVDARIAGHSWLPDGSALIFSAALDGTLALYTVGLKDGTVAPLDVHQAAWPDTARSGNTVVYEVPRTKLQLAQVPLGTRAPDDAQEPDLLARSTGSDTSPAFSPDGETIVFISNRNGSQQVWLYVPASSAEPYPITDFKNAMMSNPRWSEDGQQVLVTVREGDKRRLVQIDAATRRQQIVAASQDVLLSGSYGPEPGSYLVIRRTPTAHSELVLLQHADTPQETVVSIAPAVAHVELDRKAKALFYTRNDAVGVFRRPLDGGKETLVTDKVTSSTLDGWRVVDGRVWYVSGMMLKPFDLHEVDPATGSDRALARVGGWLYNVNFGVAPDGKRILIAPMGPEDVDVGALTLSNSAP